MLNSLQIDQSARPTVYSSFYVPVLLNTYTKLVTFAPRFSDRVADAGTADFVAFVAAVRVSKLPQIET